jgi:flavin-binding protein dodecin
MESRDGDEPPPRGIIATPTSTWRKTMAKAKSKKARGGDSVYRITELVGTSTVSWEDAAKRAIETAAGSLRDLRVADIVKLDVKVDGGKVVAYRARVSLSFKYEA